jgi:hypothetical protein
MPYYLLHQALFDHNLEVNIYNPSRKGWKRTSSTSFKAKALSRASFIHDESSITPQESQRLHFSLCVGVQGKKKSGRINIPIRSEWSALSLLSPPRQEAAGIGRLISARLHISLLPESRTVFERELLLSDILHSVGGKTGQLGSILANPGVFHPTNFF